MAGLRADAPDLLAALVYDPVEVNPFRRAEITDRLGGLVRPGGLDERTPVQGVVLANEFLDALPVHRLVQEGGRLQELFVGWDDAAGRLVEQPGDPSSADLGRTSRASMECAWPRARWSRSAWPSSRGWPRSPPGSSAGSCWSSTTATPLLVLYDPTRVGGTLRAYAGQRAHADPFIAIGRQDLTAHVDLTALEAAARGLGFDLLGDISQAELLVGCGLEELLDRIRSDPATTMEDWLAVRSAVARLLDPAALGGFRAVLLGRGLDPRPILRGLAARRPTA